MEKATNIDIEKIDTSGTEFQSALQVINHTPNSVFLTGKAGTGKSTFLKYLTATTKKKFVILAPTGIAAVNAGGQTLHSFFHLPFRPMLTDDPDVASARRLRQRFKYARPQINLLRHLDLIIIDEISMVRADVIDLIDRILRVYCNQRLPFGGKQLLLVGDVFQLEPVITGDVRDILAHKYADGMYFFNAKVFDILPLVPVELTKVFRQKDEIFIRLLDRIRVGNPLDSDIRALNRLVGTIPTGEMTMTIASRRDTVDAINARELSLLPGTPRTFTGRTTGEFPDASLPTDKELELKIGAQVVFIRNDAGLPATANSPAVKRWVNGTLGKVYDFGEDVITVELADGSRHAVAAEVWENVRYSYNEEKKKVEEDVIGTFTQYPLKAAWAITIHKSQGLTFDHVSIDIGQGAFSGGQTYVALSRCRSLSGISLRSTINIRDIFVNPTVVRFSQSFNDTSLITRALNAATADADYASAAHAFDRGDFSEASRMFAKAVNARNELHRPQATRLIARKLGIITRQKDEIAHLQARLAGQQRLLDSLAEEYTEMGRQCLQEGWDTDAALANFDKALSLNPRSAEANIQRALALAEMQRYDDAMCAFRQAARLAPSDERPLLMAARLATGSGDIADALDLLLQALRLAPRDPDVHDAAADAYEKCGDDANALLHRAKARKLRSRRNK